MKITASIRPASAIFWAIGVVLPLSLSTDLCEGREKGSRVRVIKRSAFRNQLEFLLKQGLVAKENVEAVEACRALILSKDTGLVDCVVDAVLDTRNKTVCKQVLSACLPSRRATGDEALAAFLRVVALGRFALAAEEYRTFLQIYVDQLDSEHMGARSMSLSRLRTVQPYLREAFEGTVSIGAFPKKVRQDPHDPAYCKEVQLQWQRWLRIAEPKRLRMGVVKWRNRLESPRSPTKKKGDSGNERE